MKKANKPSAFPLKKFAIIIAVGIICLFIVSTFAVALFKEYNENVQKETSLHLLEIGTQIADSIEREILYNWNILSAVEKNLSAFETQDEEKMCAFLRQLPDIYAVDDIALYNENGFTETSKNNIKYNDLASDLVYHARMQGGDDMSIIKSSVTFTRALSSDITLHGAKVVALSIVIDLDSFLDKMEITNFRNNAHLYLTQEDGSKISQLKKNNAPLVYNALTLFENRNVKNLSCNQVFDGTLPHDKDCVYHLSGNGENTYLVSVPVHIQTQNWRLFYSVPEKIVNRSTKDFSFLIAVLCFSLLFVFIAILIVCFVILFKKRMNKYSEEFRTRNRMVDLMIANTQNVFALVSLKQKKWLYISSNAKDVFTKDSFNIRIEKKRFQIYAEDGSITPTMREINKALMQWDGVSDFHSDYILFNEKGANTHYFILRLYPVLPTHDECVVIMYDVTKEKEREEELVVALQMADSASAAKTKFLSNMSHDIRTPMNAIINMTDFAIDSMDNHEEEIKYLNTIKSSSNHLLHLINDILDMSRIESGHLKVEETPFDIRDTLTEIESMINPLCVEKHISLSTVRDVQHIHLRGDVLKLRQILINIVNNAIKFTNKNGAVRLSVHETQNTESNKITLRFTIEDNGIGMSEVLLQHLFEPFVRADNADANQIEGTGLGLSICKSYVTLLGGELAVQSTLNEGSTFIINMPFTVHAKEEQQQVHVPLSDTPFTGKHALVCEDHKINQAIAKRILEKLGFVVDIAENGQQGLQKFLDNSLLYDIIYMDIQMPIMNGYVTAHKIRESEKGNAKTIPILAMTANVFQEDVEKANAVGMNGHIAKPLVIEEIIKETYKVL